ncbi:hypothetical protein ACFSQT_14275 [Mesorhizobium calcicola]|uniref:Uncharacterized protein n=1 Tax=Mesorhizobium calcicola TaxID=1300310 RepID=A0ABW4WDJ6_9HYPH
MAAATRKDAGTNEGRDTMFTEKEAKAEILIALGAIDAVRQRLHGFKKVRLHECGAAGLTAALDEAESIRAAAADAFGQTLDLLCAGMPTRELNLDLARELRQCGDQLHRAETAVAFVAEKLVSVAGDAADEALRTRLQSEIDDAIGLLDRARVASATIAERKIDGLIRMPKFWASACAKEIAALRVLKVREAA